MKTVDISGTEKKECLKPNIDGHETNSKIKTIRDLYISISDYKNGYQPITNIEKDEKGDLFTDFHSISVRWRNHFFLSY